MIGMLLGGRYEIIEEIGTGGMAIVYRAKDRKLGRYVALKVLRDELAEDEEFIHRFNIESHAAANLSHPNIVSVFDVGSDEGIHYIVMELVEGITLKEYIRRHGVLSWRQAVRFAVQICSALDHAHEMGTVHRDIKPHNMLVTKDNVLKVTDFGIARISTASTMTMSGNTMGSVHYLSPEQARGGYMDERSDIYSTGIVMYEMMAGRVPFDGESPIAIAIMHIQRPPVSPKEYNISIPLDVVDIVMKAIRKDQRARYQSAGEMLEELEIMLGTAPNKNINMKGGIDAMANKKKKDDLSSTRKVSPANGGGSGKSGKSGKGNTGSGVKGAPNKGNSGKNPNVKGNTGKGPAGKGSTGKGPIGKEPIDKDLTSKVPDIKKEDTLIKDECFDEPSYTTRGHKIRRTYSKTGTPKGKADKAEKRTTIFAIIAAVLVVGMVTFGMVYLMFPNAFGSKVTAEVPSVVGMNFDEVVQNYAGSGFVFKARREYNATVEENFIVSQDPLPGKSVPIPKEGKEIVVVVSNGVEPAKLKNYVDLEAITVESELRNLGYQVTKVPDNNPEKPEGIITKTDPIPNSAIITGQEITLYVSTGKGNMITMTSLIGLTEAAARDAIAQLNLVVGTVSQQESDSTEGTVISQSVAGGAEIREFDTVDITVAIPSTTTELPPVEPNEPTPPAVTPPVVTPPTTDPTTPPVVTPPVVTPPVVTPPVVTPPPTEPTPPATVTNNRIFNAKIPEDSESTQVVITASYPDGSKKVVYTGVVVRTGNTTNIPVQVTGTQGDMITLTATYDGASAESRYVTME